jgi:predicted kinase
MRPIEEAADARELFQSSVKPPRETSAAFFISGANMQEVVIFIGLQGAGKSTFHAQRFAASHVLVSKDLFPNNRRPARRQEQLLTEALAAARSVVVDNTNPSRADRAEIIRVARTFGARVVGYYFASPLAECQARNAARARRVPEVGLLATARKLEPPSAAEGFDQLFLVRTLPEQQFDVTPYPETRDEPR